MARWENSLHLPIAHLLLSQIPTFPCVYCLYLTLSLDTHPITSLSTLIHCFSLQTQHIPLSQKLSSPITSFQAPHLSTWRSFHSDKNLLFFSSSSPKHRTPLRLQRWAPLPWLETLHPSPLLFFSVARDRIYTYCLSVQKMV